MLGTRRIKARIKKAKQQKLYVVYTARIGRTNYYIGQGVIGREKHVNSGCSHVYELNKMHFEGVIFDVKIEKYQTKEEAAQREEFLIREKRPKFNKVFINDKRTQRMQILGIFRTFIFDKGAEFLQSKKCTTKDLQRLENILGMNTILWCTVGVLHKNMHEDVKYHVTTIESGLRSSENKSEFLNYFYHIPCDSKKLLVLAETLTNDFCRFLESNHKEKLKDFEEILKEREDFINEARRKTITTD